VTFVVRMTDRSDSGNGINNPSIDVHERRINGRPSFLRWVRATWGGWVLGVPCIAALALLGEAIGIGGAQLIVGAGMGVGVGWLQARALRGLLPAVAPWFWSAVIGLTLPFLVVDIATAAGWSLPYWLYVTITAGGLLVGCAQWLILRRHFKDAPWWIAASSAGWGLAGGAAAIADALMKSRQIRGIGGLLAYLALIAVGGLVLGVVTGLCLARLRPRDGG
jgi:hypothetical protein